MASAKVWFEDFARLRMEFGRGGLKGTQLLESAKVIQPGRECQR